jgi:predicted amidohydrolase YtcJ
MQSKVTIFTARKVITMSPARPEGAAVAIRDGRILGTGTVEELKGWGPHEVDDRFSDLVLIPGLIEAHSHIGEGTHWRFPYIGYFDRYAPDGKLWKGCKRFDDVLAVLKKLDADMSEPGESLAVWGFDPIYFAGERLNVSHLDRISETRPIFVFHASDHLATVNSALMKKMGITKDIDVEGVAKGPDGQLNGELQEPNALRLAGDIYYQIADGSGVDDNWQTYGIQAKNAGCTTIGEMAYGSPADQAAVDRLKRIVDYPEYPVRIVELFLPLLAGPDDPKEGARWCIELSRHSTEKLRLGIVKLFLDGSIQGFTARLREPGYYNGRPNGIWLMDPETFPETLLEYHRAGLTIHCHCNGDEAVDVFLDALEQAQAKAPWPDHRHTIQHCQLTTKNQYQRMANLGICANIFANHIYYWGDQHYQITVGPDRAERMEACATAKKLGVHFTLHSDAPITPINQLHSAWCAVNRLTATGRVLGEHERISVYDALYAVTLDAAYTLKMDDDVGSIEPGKLADFTVLEEDPFVVDPMKLKDIKIWGTVLGGKLFPATRR